MHGLGIVSQFSENISLWKVTVAPAANSGRVISSWADCFHFSGCRGKISLDSCLTSGSHDDAVNIHGTQLQIVIFLVPTGLKCVSCIIKPMGSVHFLRGIVLLLSIPAHYCPWQKPN